MGNFCPAGSGPDTGGVCPIFCYSYLFWGILFGTRSSATNVFWCSFGSFVFLDFGAGRRLLKRVRLGRPSGFSAFFVLGMACHYDLFSGDPIFEFTSAYSAALFVQFICDPLDFVLHIHCIPPGKFILVKSYLSLIPIATVTRSQFHRQGTGIML
jgi:hypothetical protein